MHEGSAGNDVREPAQDPSCRLCFLPGTSENNTGISRNVYGSYEMTRMCSMSLSTGSIRYCWPKTWRNQRCVPL
ncbi:hypothetical protein MA16_Dca019105 [Dendrobium catenatum]|uniref:Uncharacterized protein n=1 Tax=Dendrobium catenatum TaxID=906689 RepID=A0A2I0WP95_9ASPA|nr:hypothetical protein MA16_Dca019105 [Dendrobium catenatum]